MDQLSVRPKRRQQLHAYVIAQGFKSISDFSRNIECAQSTMSSVINGWRFPGRLLQERISRGLKISLSELRAFLEEK